jgi:endonuclease/exonuclease/phosphatase (EEP) superfamily protein YafD
MTFRSILFSKPRSWILRIAIVGAVFPVLGWIGGRYWVLDLFNHVQFHYLGFFLCCVVILLAMKAFREAAMVAGLLLLPLARIVPSCIAPPAAVSAQKPLRVAAFNVLVSNERHEDTLRWVRESQLDCIYFSETTHQWAKALEVLAKDYPYSIEEKTGFAFYSKYPIAHYRIVHCSDFRFPLLIAYLDTPQGEVAFFGIHPLPPVNKRWAKALRDTMEVLAYEVEKERHRVIVAGDFNLTRWSNNAQPLERAQLRDASYGKSPGATWMRHNAFFAIPIDRILYRGDGMDCRSFHIGPDLGSDHRPVVAEMAW